MPNTVIYAQVEGPPDDLRLEDFATTTFYGACPSSTCVRESEQLPPREGADNRMNQPASRRYMRREMPDDTTNDTASADTTWRLLSKRVCNHGSLRAGRQTPSNRVNP